MKRLFFALVCAALVVGCGSDPTPYAPAPRPAFSPLPRGGDNPADNGPDDSLVIDGQAGTRAAVPFKHYTHASNAEGGFGVPCAACHHTAKANELPSDGCAACHAAATSDDPAHGGPDDNLLLGLGRGGRMPAVAFDHFTHASSAGHKLACDKCHHTGELVSCESCHEPLAKKRSDGAVVVKWKRAFHRQCQQCHNALAAASDTAKAPTTCKGCHTGEILARRPGNLPRDRAFHQSCVTCHQRDRLARGVGRAPIACADCHKGAPPPPPQAPASPPPQADTQADSTPAAAKATPPDKLLIDHAQKAQPGTPFDHKAHANLGEPCTKCHHTGLDQPKCRDCHADPAEAKRVYHKSCIGCHKENGIAAGCGDCHKKNPA